MDEKAVFAIDITHTTLTAAFVFPDGRMEEEADFELVDFMVGDADYAEKLCSLLAAKARPFKPGISSVMVAIPCDLSAERRTVLDFPHALWLNHKPLADILQDDLGVPVIMERRSVVHLTYDRAMHGLPLDSLIVGCYIDEHYENAVWYRGGPMLGKNGAAGNIAHMTIHNREDNCFCGKYGCVDLYGAGLRFKKIHTMIFPDSPREFFFERFGEHPIVQDYLNMMAYPIAIEANILDPDFIVIGGSIPSLRGFPMKTLEDAIRKQCYYPLPAANLVLLPSTAGSVSGALVAAQYPALRTVIGAG